MYHAGMTEARAQAAGRHRARAVLFEPARPPVTTAASSGDDQARTLAKWQGTGTAPRTGEVLATFGSPAGRTVTVWLDASGKLTRPPLQPGQITDRIIVVATLAPTVLALSLLTALRLAQRLADRRRLCRVGCSLVDGRTAMDPAQSLTGADDAANTGEPDQPASNATTRPGQAETRSAPTPAGPGRGDGLAGHFTAESRSGGALIPENDVDGCSYQATRGWAGRSFIVGCRAGAAGGVPQRNGPTVPLGATGQRPCDHWPAWRAAWSRRVC